MGRFHYAALVAVAVIGFASVASAADMPVNAAPMVAPVPVYNWTGWYVGGNIGYGWGDSTDPQLSVVNPGGAGNIGAFLTTGIGGASGNEFPSLKPKGVTGGIQFGYDQQVTNWLWGVVADFQAANFDDSALVTTSAVTTLANLDESLSAKVDWFGTVRGKLGVIYSNDWLAYGTGGLAYGHVKSTIGFACTPGGVNCSSVSLAGSSTETRVGWAAGAGLAYHIPGSRISVGVEYLHIDLGRSSVTAVDQIGTFPTTTITESQKLANEIVRATFNYKLW